MFAYARRVLFLPVIAALAACSGATAGSTTPSTSSALAATGDTIQAALDAAPQVGGGRELFKKLAVRPDAGSPAWLINFVSNGPAQGGVPCIACVNGASSSDNIGLTGPSSYVYSNSEWQYSLSFTDITYKGKCKLAWAITSGKKTIDSFGASLGITSSGGFVLYALNRSRPKYSGPATLTGKVTCGKTSQSLQVPIQFQ